MKGETYLSILHWRYALDSSRHRLLSLPFSFRHDKNFIM